jgi:hypothetical protein
MTRKVLTRKLLSRRMKEIDGDIFEIITFEETTEINGRKGFGFNTVMKRTPYKEDHEIEVTDATKSLIQSIANKKEYLK